MKDQSYCNICPRKCNIDRQKTVGFCGANNNVKIAKVMLHYFEEPIISGTEDTIKKGSGAIFFSNCSLKCIYCQNHEISSGGLGKEISIETLADIFKQLEEAGATNINLVSPSHYSLQIIEALKLYRPSIPIVWNTSGYESIETLKLIEGFVDIYLTDFKYFDSNLAKEYSLAPDYVSVAKTALLEMKRQQPQDIIENGLMKKGIIVRHMLLPGSVQNSLSVLEYLYQNYGNHAYISVMSQYTPFYKAKTHPLLKNRITPLEYKVCERYLQKHNFINVFLQDLNSASSDYTPNFTVQDYKFKY